VKDPLILSFTAQGKVDIFFRQHIKDSNPLQAFLSEITVAAISWSLVPSHMDTQITNTLQSFHITVPFDFHDTC